MSNVLRNKQVNQRSLVIKGAIKPVREIPDEGGVKSLEWGQGTQAELKQTKKKTTAERGESEIYK